MSVLALFLGLLLDQFRPLHTEHRVYGAMRRVVLRIQHGLDAGSPAQAWIAWLAVVAGPAIVAWLVFWGLDRWIGGWAAFLWSIMVVYTCLEFRAFGLRFTEVRNAFNTGEYARAAHALARWRQALVQPGAAVPALASDGDAEDGDGDEAALTCSAVRLSLEHVHRYVFGVFTAFLLLAALGLGPLGAVLFRAADYVFWTWHRNPHRSWAERASPALARVAGQGWHAVNWLPARVTALMAAAVGGHDEALANWRASFTRAPRDTDALVVATGAAAMGLTASAVAAVVALDPASTGAGTLPEPGDAGHPALLWDGPVVLHGLATLIWRVLLLWLMIWLVFVLIDAVL